MKLSYQCINDIMLVLQEKLDYFQTLDGEKIIKDPSLKKYTENELSYSLIKIYEMGLIEVKDSSVIEKWVVLDITIDGHNYLRHPVTD